MGVKGKKVGATLLKTHSSLEIDKIVQFHHQKISSKTLYTTTLKRFGGTKTLAKTLFLGSVIGPRTAVPPKKWLIWPIF